MTIRQKLEILAKEKNAACVTISLNTHRTHPDNIGDAVQLRNLLREAEDRAINEFGKKAVSSLLDKLSTIRDDIDFNYNLDSLHIYLSNDTMEVIHSPWPTPENGVFISNEFDVRSLIKLFNRIEEYYILLLSQRGVNLYAAMNDGIVNEIVNEDFPFIENRQYTTHEDRKSDAKYLDDLVREFLNKVDKAVVKVFNDDGLNCVVICTEDNFSRLMQVADKPGIYYGYARINYNNIETHHIAKQGWEMVRSLQSKKRSEAIREMKEAVGRGGVLTDLQEIYRASIDGRGDLLIVHQDFAQAVRMTSERTFELVDNRKEKGVIDDITSKITWEVLLRKGRVIFTEQDEIKELGSVVLKTRF